MLIAFAALASKILEAPPRCGATRLVCVDGPSGSGKTVLAGRLAAALIDPALGDPVLGDPVLGDPALGDPALGDPVLVHMDDLYPGWDGLDAAVPLLHEWIVAPLVAGRAAAYRRYDWVAGQYAEEHVLGQPDVLVVEGVGAGSAAANAVALIWVEAPRAERFRRGIERDGEAYRPHWERWARQEDALFARERTRDRATLLVDGAPSVPHDPQTHVVRHG